MGAVAYIQVEEALIAVAVVLAVGLIGSAAIYWLLRPKKDAPDDRDPFGDSN
jgi:hypothetical protein